MVCQRCNITDCLNNSNLPITTINLNHKFFQKLTSSSAKHQKFKPIQNTTENDPFKRLPTHQANTFTNIVASQNPSHLKCKLHNQTEDLMIRILNPLFHPLKTQYWFTLKAICSSFRPPKKLQWFGSEKSAWKSFGNYLVHEIAYQLGSQRKAPQLNLLWHTQRMAPIQCSFKVEHYVDTDVSTKI